MKPLNQMRETLRVQNLIDTIQADCHLVSQDKSDYGKED